MLRWLSNSNLGFKKDNNDFSFLIFGEKVNFGEIKRCFVFVLTLNCLLSVPFSHAIESEKYYELQISSSKASIALRSLARQTQSSLLFQNTEIESVITNAISGRYTLNQALDLLLAGTTFSGNFTEKRVITISHLSAEDIKQSEQNLNESELTKGLAAIAAVDRLSEEETFNNHEQKMVIVGSRAAARSIGDSPVPVDVISADELLKNGAQDMLSMLANVVPSFNVNAQPIADAATFIRPANLRGLPPDNTLVLVNGKRRHRASVIAFIGGGIADGSQGPDVSVIPTIALKQVEILRDGASAQYGSDAIAGVINFVLKDLPDGGIFESKYGQHYEGDGDTVQFSANIGVPLTDAGFVNLSFEWREQGPTSRSVQRDDALELIAAGNTFIRTPVAQVWGSPEVNNDFKFWLNSGLDLGGGKQLYSFVNWAERSVEGGFFFRNPNTRSGVYAGPGIDDGIGFDVDGNPILSSTILVGDISDDALDNSACPVVRIIDSVPDPVALALLPSSNCFAFNSMFPGGFTPLFGGEILDMSLTAGIRGEFGDGISFDFSTYIGESSSNFELSNSVNGSLGPNSPTSFKTGGYTQREKAFNADFVKTFDVLTYAWGLEWRQDIFEIMAGDAASFEVGPLAAQGFSSGSNGFNGFSTRSQGSFSRTNISAYSELEYEFSDDFLIDLAVRYEKFSDFGTTTNFKLSGIYNLNQQFAVRGGTSTGFRAPTVGQSNVTNVTTAFDSGLGLIDQATLPPTNPISVQLGGKPLQPENSESVSFGLVYENDNSLFVTADFFHIEVTDRIAQTSNFRLSDSDREELIAQGVIDAINFNSVKFFTNDFDTTTEGIDLVVSYTAEIFAGTDTKFNLAYNHTTTQVDDFDPDIISETRVKQLEQNLPNERATFTIAHSNGNWDSFFRLNYYGDYFEAHQDSGDLPINGDSAFIVDVELSFNITKKIRLAAGVQNLFDKLPNENEFSGVDGAKYPSTSPFGFNGGFWYIKTQYLFD
ncbi:MAG: iron complex outermembrane receptor protein [Polaribacter sp.]|jgi:iron complex outermembrane receptor protein